MYKSDRIAFNQYFDTDYGDNLACRHCGLFHVTPESTQFQKMAAEFREWFGRVMPIVSGSRCEYWNEHEGGATDSMHLYGLAFDIAFTSEFYNFTAERKREFLFNIKNKWRELSVKYKVRGGVGCYNNWFHLDARPLDPNKRHMAVWDRSIYFK